VRLTRKGRRTTGPHQAEVPSRPHDRRHTHPKGSGPTGDDPSVILVTRARAGDQEAWNAQVERYAPIVWSICRRYQLGGADASDAGQNVWLHLVDQLSNIRDPAAIRGWPPLPSENTTWSCARRSPPPSKCWTPRPSPASTPALLSTSPPCGPAARRSRHGTERLTGRGFGRADRLVAAGPGDTGLVVPA